MNITKEQIREWVYENSNPRSDGVITFSDEIDLSDSIQDCIQDLAPKWVSVEDELPGDGVPVLIEYEGEVLMAYINNGDWIESSAMGDEWADFTIEVKGGFFGCVSVTHWMPLPEPPNETLGQ